MSKGEWLIIMTVVCKVALLVALIDLLSKTGLIISEQGGVASWM